MLLGGSGRAGTPPSSQVVPAGSRGRAAHQVCLCFKSADGRRGTGTVLPPGSQLTVSLKIPYRCNFGQNLGVVGSGEPLGNWDPMKAVRMRWTEGDWWTADLRMHPGTKLEIEYKYIVLESDGHVSRWKPGGNYKLVVPIMPQANKVAEKVKVADAWDESFKTIDIVELELAAAAAAAAGAAKAGGSGAGGAAEAPAAAGDSVAQAAASSSSSSFGVALPQQEQQQPQQQQQGPGSGLPAQPRPLTEGELLQEGMMGALMELQQQVQRHQTMRANTDDAATLDIIVADRIVAAANNKVIAYSKALKAVEAYPKSQIPQDRS